MANEMQVKKDSLDIVRENLARVDVRKRFEDVLGKKAPQFMTSLVNAVAGNSMLQQCDPNTIMSSAFVASALDLPIDSNLGFSAIVPYAGKAQFQVMYRGFVQLAIRTGQYKSINSTEVFADEYESYNPFTGEVTLKIPTKDMMRYKADEKEKQVVGFYACFELLTGFKKDLYMTIEEVEAHATKYSKSYVKDKREKKASSKWTTDFVAMGKKTVIKLILSKWGMLSIELQKAITHDQSIIDEQENPIYADNPENKVLEKEGVVDPFKNAQPAEIIQSETSNIDDEFAPPINKE